MPNGGSDCCGTCSFNAKNKGEVGYEHAADPEADFCLIRHLPISRAFWTYCANHPFHNEEKVEVPIGPVFRVDSYPYQREIWVASPDTEEIRLKLLERLHQIQEQPPVKYPSPLSLEEIVIWQLGAFREKRAVDDLRRIMAFDSKATNPLDKFKRTRELTVKLAKEALNKIEAKNESFHP
jgi:hypothetical protein